MKDEALVGNNNLRTSALLGDFAISSCNSQAADSILRHSFAIHRVDSETAQAIHDAWIEARRFFDDTQNKDRDTLVEKYQRVQNGHLHGYNVPSNAKFLFRAFCGASAQPWPGQEFREASTQLAGKLHALLVDCCNEVDRKVACKLSNGQSTAPKEEITRSTHSKKRRKMSPVSHKRTDTAITALCPLDFFLYHGRIINSTNQHSSAVVNCSKHIDRGALICVCLTRIPGLELLPRGKTNFICPETITHNENLYQERQSCSDLICIMAGDQLKQPGGSTSNELTACVHRVRNDLKGARLSISYELRLQ